MISKVTDTVIYVGVNDHDVDLFEGQYVVPNGMAYNSYVIKDEKIAVMDSVDKSKTEEWLSNVAEALDGAQPDYLIVQHMEPDHAGSIVAFTEKYPEAVVVGNKKTFTVMGQFYPSTKEAKQLEVKDMDTLCLGAHTLTFVFAPMVHWPEVMMTYDSTDKILFAADGFGKFGALDVEEDWACEARRYYIGIVGKFGKPVQNILKKASGLDIAIICPLHGPVLSENLGYYLNLYDLWSSYTPESKGVMIYYASVYGHTKAAAEYLEAKLNELGVPHAESVDLARSDMAENVEDAFRYDTCVLASVTYSASIFPVMDTFIHNLVERDFQNRRVALIQNGSWAPNAAKVMTKELEGCKNLTFAENTVTILSAMNDESKAQLDALAEELAASYK